MEGRRIVLALLCWCLSTLAVGQNDAIESLTSQLNQLSAPSCDRAALLNDYYEALAESGKADSGQVVLEEVFSIAKEKGCDDHAADAHLLKSKWYSDKGELDSAKAEVQLYHDYAVSVKDTKRTILALQQFMQAHTEVGKYKEAQPYGLEALAILDTMKGIANDSTLIEQHVTIAYGVAASYYNNKESDVALKQLLLAQELAERYQFEEMNGRMYGLFGMIFVYMREYAQAIDYARKNVEWCKKNGSTGLGDAYSHLSYIYRADQQLDTALVYGKLALEVAQENNDTWLINSSSTTLAKILELMGRHSESLEYAQLSLETNIIRNNERGIATSHIVIAVAHQGLKNYDKAIYHIKVAMELGKNQGVIQNSLDYLYEVLTELYIATGQKEKAKESLALLVAHVDSLKEADIRSALAESKVEFETEQTENENLRLQLSNDSLATQKAISDAEASRTTTQLYAVGGVGGLMLILGVISFRAYRRKERDAKKLAAQDAEKAVLLKEIHHRVKNNLQVISSLLNLQSRSISDPKALSAVKEGQNRVKSIALIHQKLYQTEGLARIQARDYVEQLSGALHQMFGNSELTIAVDDIPPGLSLDIDTAVPLGLILNELITNSLKHGFEPEAKGRIEIEISETAPGKLTLVVWDDGKGITADLDPSKVKSLGMRLIRELSRQVHGEIKWSNDTGTRFVMSFEETTLRKTQD